MRPEAEIRKREQELRDQFEATKYLTQEHEELRRGGMIQALRWVLGEGDI